MNSGYIIKYQDGKEIEADIRPVDLVDTIKEFSSDTPKAK